MAITRAIDPVSVRDPENEGVMQTLDPAKMYRTDDPLVKAYPWAFASDDERDSGVEAATTEPGSRRSAKRPG